MIEETRIIINKSKQSLDTLLRKKAIDEVKEYLIEKDINMDDVEDKDIESLVEAKVKDMESTLKGVAVGGVFVIVFETIFGF
jgi:hypothetical protein